jgi:hypothetical protein
MTRTIDTPSVRHGSRLVDGTSPKIGGLAPDQSPRPYPARHHAPNSSATAPGRVEQVMPRMRLGQTPVRCGIARHVTGTIIAAKRRSNSHLSWQLVLPGSIRLYGQRHFGGTGMSPGDSVGRA